MLGKIRERSGGDERRERLDATLASKTRLIYRKEKGKCIFEEVGIGKRFMGRVKLTKK